MAVGRDHPAEFYIEGILRRDVVILSRAITLTESSRADHQQLSSKIIDGIIAATGKSFRLGITGVPGVGKSTFIETFGKHVLAENHRLAVLAIDPSSARHKGSILGDKTRMENLSSHPDVFIRPSPSGGTLGGVTKMTYETILLCEAAGYDYIIIETVGVGQSETEVSRITDFFLLLMLAGAGDELQGIKRGIMEMADAVVITKADGDNLKRAQGARSDFSQALHMLRPPENGWVPKAMVCSATENKGVKEVMEMISSYHRLVETNGALLQKRKDQQYQLLLQAINDQLLSRFYNNKEVNEALIRIKQGQILQPFKTAHDILRKFS